MPRTVTVTLAGTDYQITELRSRANAAWREQLREPFGALVDRLEGAGETNVTSARDVVGLVRETAGTLLQAPDLLGGLLFAYSPELARDRERIIEEAYDSEILSAFVEVLKLAFPFGGIVQRLAGLAAIGQKPPMTMPS